MKDFLPRYLKYMFLVGASVASLLGLLVAVWTDVRWLVVFYVCANFLASVVFCFAVFQELQAAREQRNAARAEAEREGEERKQVETQLQSISAECLLTLQKQLRAYSLQRAAQYLAELADRLGRMSSLLMTDRALDVRTVESQGGTVYVVAKATAEAERLVKAGDMFYLVKSTRSNINHPVAVLSVIDNFQSRNRGVALKVVRSLDTEFCEGLVALARSTDRLQGLKGLQVKPMIEVAVLQGVDMVSASRAIAILRSILEEPWLGDASNGD